MIPVATSEKVIVRCPKDGSFSFFNSPYPSHRLSTGVDIYPNIEYGENASSPVSGEITLIRKIRCPGGRGFKDSGYDVVTVLRSHENPERVIKFLHVEPALKCGDFVETGQELGSLLRSGYFSLWTSPHIHVEIRNPFDPIRARGGYPFRRLLEIGDVKPVEELKGTVTKTIHEFSIVRIEEDHANGLTADVGGVTGLLDGGIPYYGWVGTHIGSNPPTGRVVKLCGKPIAIIKTLRGKTCLADCLDFKINVGMIPIRGLSLRLSPRALPEIKLIPFKPEGLQLEEDSEVSLSIE